MSLRIIKKESADTAAVQPFFFSYGRPGSGPEPYVLPEVASPGEMSPNLELEMVGAKEPPIPAIDVEQIEKDAFERGWNAGRDEGLAEGLKAGEEATVAKIEEMSRHYGDSLAEIAVLKDALRAQVEEEVVRLAIAVARKVVHREINIDQTVIHALVRVALGRVSGKSAVVVHLNPTDREYMMRAHEELMREEGREITFESNSTIGRGGCVIQSETGDIDARIEEEFREVESAFFEGL